MAVVVGIGALGLSSLAMEWLMLVIKFFYDIVLLATFDHVVGAEEGSDMISHLEGCCYYFMAIVLLL